MAKIKISDRTKANTKAIARGVARGAVAGTGIAVGNELTAHGVKNALNKDYDIFKIRAIKGIEAQLKYFSKAQAKAEVALRKANN